MLSSPVRSHLPGKEPRFPPQPPFELSQKVKMIDPIPRRFQGFGTLRRIDGRADRNRAGQRSL